MKRVFQLLFSVLLGILLLLNSTLLYALELTPEEQEWLQAHPDIEIGLMDAWPPLDYVNGKGVAVGIGAGFVEALNGQLGKDYLKIRSGSWKDIYEKVKEKKMPCLMGITPRQDREEYFNFTSPYITVPHVIIARRDSPYAASISDLDGLSVAVERDFYVSKLLKKQFPGISVSEYPDTFAALDAVSKGDVHAYIGNRAVALYIIEEELILNLVFQGTIKETNSVNAIGVRKDWPILRDILQKALDGIPEDERRLIVKHWVSPEDKRIDLSRDEKLWIKAHPEVIYTNRNWPPLFIAGSDGSSPSGLFRDIYKKIEALSGLQFKYRPYPGFGEMLDAVYAGEVDLLDGTGYTEGKDVNALLTDAYLQFPLAIASEKGKSRFTSIDDLAKKNVAVVEQCTAYQYLQKQHPEIGLIPVQNTEEALLLVAQGQADAVIGILPALDHGIKRQGLVNLVVSGFVGDYQFNIHGMVNPDAPELVSILNKSFKAISNEDYQSIYDSWFNQEIHNELQMEIAPADGVSNQVLKWLGILLILFAGTIFVIWLIQGCPRSITIRQLIFLVSFIFVGLIVFIGTFIAMLMEGVKEQSIIELNKHEVHNLAVELKKSSDDLTRFVRAYAATADPKYEKYYKEVVAIRDGNQAHPQNYTDSYWDFVTGNLEQRNRGGEIYSIEGRIEQLGVSDQELEKLKKAEEESDALVILETNAFNLVKGFYDDGSGQYQRKGMPNPELALSILYGEEYHEAKARIMKPVEEFFQLFELRTNSSLNSLRNKNRAILLMVAVLTVITILFAVYVFFLFQRRIIGPLRFLEHGSHKIKDGDYSFQLDIKSEDEVGSLASAFNEMSRNIEERTKALSVSEKAFRGLFDTLRDAAIITDGELIIDCNQAALEMFGYESKKKLIEQHPRHLSPILQPDGKKSLDKARKLMTLAQARKGHLFEWMHKHTDGSEFLCEVLLSPAQFKGRTVVQRVIRDITERKKIEEEIRYSEAQLKSIISTIPGTVYKCLFDQKWTMKYISNEIENLCGYPSGDFIENDLRSFSSIIHPDDIDRVESAVHHAVEHRTAYTIEYRVIHKDGGIRSVYEKGQAEYDASGNPTFLNGTILDMTERREMEEEIKRINLLSDKALDLTRSGFWRIDYKTPDLIYSSKRSADIFGESYTGNFIYDFNREWLSRIMDVDPKIADETKNNYLAAVEGSVSRYDATYPYKRPNDGKIAWIRALGEVIRNDAGDPVFMYGVNQDITEQRKAEMALAVAEEKSRTLLESAGEGIFGLTTEGKVSFINPAALRMLGYEADELMGKESHGAIHHSRADGVRYSLEDCPIFKTCSQGKRVDGTNELLWRKDGSSFYVDYSCNPVHKEGKLVGSVVTFRDVTEKRIAEAELRKLSVAVEQSPASIVITDLDGSIEYANPKFTEVTGYTLEEALGQNPRVLKAGDHSAEFYRNLWMTIKDGKEWRGEFCNKKKNGDIFWESASISPLKDSNGEITHFVAIKEDITQKREYQEELRKAKEVAEAATQAKSDFLANMSHEIRTPMNAIIGMTHLALKTDLNPKQEDYIAKTQNAAQSLLGIINDILDFSKIEAGKLEIEEVEFNLDEVLESVSDLISLKAQEKDIEFLLRVEYGLPEILLGDPLRIKQIILNLCTNAVKFTESGEIEVSVKKVEDNNCETGRKLTLEVCVRDTGIGLTEDQRKKLFKSFSQADTSTTRKYGGTGLGLSISKKLSEMMGGKIWVESVKGVGSQFHFTIEVGAEVDSQKHSYVPRIDLQHMRVLVVDDNDVAREIVTDILKSFTFEVTQADSAMTAFDRLHDADQDEPFDLILMDWNMPEINGLQAVQMIKEDDQVQKKPKVILLTAYGRDEVFREADEVGVEGFLVKPVNASMLFDAIMQAYGQDMELSSRKEKARGLYDSALESVRGARVLLVEDNEINQQVAVELLEDAGVEVTIAGNGQIAIDELNRNREFDAVLMDLQMPVLDGLSATRKIRENSEFDDLPIIAMTANAMAGDREMCIEAGMLDHIVKPIDPSQMFGTLAEYVHVDDERKKFAQENASKKEVENDEIVIPEIEGIDSKSGIDRLAGNSKLYVKLVNKFCEDQAHIIDVIRDQLEQKDHTTAVRSAHTLKGLAGNLGAKALFNEAANLESAIKNSDDDLESKLVVCEVCLEETIAKFSVIQSIDLKEEVVASKELDDETLQDSLVQLRSKLEEFDADANEIIDELLQGFKSSEFVDSLKALADSIGQYDFDKALEELDEFEKHLKS